MNDAPHENDDADLPDLLYVERELTPCEQNRLLRLAAAGWGHINGLLTRRAREMYALATAREFGECVLSHMNPEQRTDLVLADLYHCPGCGRRLKDRSAASSVFLIEHGQIRAALSEPPSSASLGT